MSERYPFVSIIIPALNEDKYIAECLDSVVNLEYPKDRFEIIVVDNGSTDNTNIIARSYPVKLIVKPGIKVGAVRNAGFTESVGEILAFTDADCILPKTWLNVALEYLYRPNIGAVGGGCLVKDSATWLEKAWVAGQEMEVVTAKYLPGANFIVNRKVFSDCGGFDEELVAGEDDNLSVKIKSQGYQLLSIKHCYVTHLGYPKTLVNVIKRQIWHSKNSIDIINPLTDKLFIATNAFILGSLLIPVLIICGISFVYTVFVILLLVCIINVQPVKKVRAWNKQNHDIAKAIIKLMQLNIIYYCYFVGRSIGLIVNYLSKIAHSMSRFST